VSVVNRRVLSVLAAALALAWGAVAEARPKHTSRVSDEYWIGHGITAGGLGVAALLTGVAITSSPPDIVPATKPAALTLSSVALTLDVLAPPVAWVPAMNQDEFADASLTYGQALFASLTANHVLRLAHLDSSAALAFAAAYVGSGMFSHQRYGYTKPKRAVDARVRDTFWGLELGLATFASHLEVRGGRRCYGEALLGTGVGTLIGGLVLRLHAERGFILAPPAENWGWGLLGAIPGVVLPLFIARPAADPLQSAGIVNLRVAAGAVGDSAHGLTLSGAW
jgi:hypothetical protein